MLCIYIYILFSYAWRLNVEFDFELTSPILEFGTGSVPGVTSSSQLTILSDSLVEEASETLVLQLITTPLARLAFPIGQDSVQGTIIDIDGMTLLLKDQNVVMFIASYILI